MFEYKNPSESQQFKEVFDTYYPSLCLYAKRYIQELKIREDIVQDVFCSLWIKRTTIDFNLPMKNYLITCVKNECLNFLRKKENNSIEYELKDDYPFADNIEDIFFLKEFEELLNKLIKELPDEYRIAFELFQNENLSNKEIAEKMNVSVRTVERYKKKATEILMKDLKYYIPILILLLSFLYRNQ